ncbi:MAG: hypothetical protein NXI31_18890 [bacterium]|nr:hypothetical protein [bacterium]
MRSFVTTRLAAFAAFAAVPLAAQGPIGPSVLDLNASYHVGIYSAAIDVPSGAVRLLAQFGDAGFQPTGMFAGALDTWEWTTAGGQFTPNDPFGGEYHVAPDAILELDLDPSNPGTDVIEMLFDPGAEVFHTARYELDPESLSLLALRKSTGLNNSVLNGTYRYFSQYMEFNNGQLETAADRGVMTINGAGGIAVNGVVDLFDSAGQVTQFPMVGSANYTVAPDGELTVNGFPGAVSSNGELFFILVGSQTSSEVGLTIAVRQGATLDLRDLAGRYGVHGQGHLLGGLGGPENFTDLGGLELRAATATAGAWAYSGETVDGDATGQVIGPATGAGACTLSPATGVLTMTDASGSIEFAFSDSGRFASGRVIENNSNLFFALRSCPENSDFGTATAGTGGIEPELGMRTFPTLGNASWRYALIEGLGGAPAILAIGFRPAAAGIPLSGGLLWLDPTRIVANPFVVLGGPAGVGGAGAVDVPLPIPSGASFARIKLFAQALVLDGAAAGGVSMSRGFAVQFCR